MIKKENKPKFPSVYRIIFRCAAWKTKSERYYTENHSSDALADIYHAFHRGRMHAHKITILDIQEYDSYSNLWVSRMVEALQQLPDDIDLQTITIKENKIILRKG